MKGPAMDSEDAFQTALDARVADAALRLVFADWLEERGDPRAEGYRWMGQAGKWPTDQRRTDRGTWGWWSMAGEPNKHAELPPDLHQPMYGVIQPERLWAFPTRRTAEEALCEAIRKANVPEPKA